MTLAELSLRRPITAIMFYVSMVVIGIIAAVRLPLEQFPDVDFPFLFINLPYPGSTPEEVERTITRPAEEAISSLRGIENVFSNSRADGSQIFIQFNDWDRDVELTASEAREQLDAIRGELPTDFQRYFVNKFSPSDEPLLRVRFAGDRDMTGEYELIERLMKRRLERVPGVAKAEITGAAAPEVEIAILPNRLGAHGLALNELATRLQAVNFSVSAGDIDDGTRRLRVQPVGELRSLDELRSLVIDDRGLRLGDIADVRLKPQLVDFGRRMDGKVAVGLDISRERNANLVDTSRAVLADVNEILKLPEFRGVKLKIISDQAESVTSSINELIEAGVVGSLLSVFVLFFFLRHWPSTWMVTLAIPLCIVMTLGAMYFLGLTLNILTMMGLLLGIGMLVDNAVVVVESIYQYRERWPNNPVRCAIEGTRSVQLAISAGTLTSIIVFAPNVFGDRNQISIFLGQVAITITIALLASWIVAVSLIPMLSARLKTPPAAIDKNNFVARSSRAYGRLLRWTIQHRGWSLVSIFFIVAASLGIAMPMTKVEMFKNDVGRELEFYYQWKGAYSLPQISEEVLRVEQFVDRNREKYQVVQIYSWFSEQGWAGTRLNLRPANPSLWDRLLLRSAEPDLLSTEEVVEMLRKDLPKSARAEIGFGDQGPPGGGGGSDEQGVRVTLSGDSNQVLGELATALVPMLATRKELRDVRVDLGDVNSEIQVQVDRERAAAYGFSAEEVARYVGIALRGTPLREFRHADAEIPVWVRFAGAQKFRMEDLAALKLRRGDGTEVPLMSVVKVDVTRGSTQISRQNRQMSVEIQANLAKDVELDKAREAMEEVLKATTFPDGYRWSFGGNFDREDRAGQQMAFNTLIALVMVYIVMAALFESLLMPAAIITSIFFSALGVFWLFAFTNTTFTMMAAIGILVLMGVVVNNGIVMFEHINNLRRAGHSRTDALVEGSCERFRPILMTMGTTILGMIPLCVGTTQIGGGGPAYYPMARAIAGGLAFSTVVSLLFLPTIYAMLDDLRIATGRLVRRAMGGRDQTAAAAAQA